MLKSERLDFLSTSGLNIFSPGKITSYQDMGVMAHTSFKESSKVDDSHESPEKYPTSERNSVSSIKTRRLSGQRTISLNTTSLLNENSTNKERVLLVKNGIPINYASSGIHSLITEKEKKTPTVPTTSVIATTGLPYRLKKDTSPSKASLLSNSVTQAQIANALKKQEDHSNCKSEIEKLKELVILHVELIEEQQETINKKDKIVADLRSETSALKTRLTRMNRRLQSVSTSSHERTTPKTSTCPNSEKPTTSKQSISNKSQKMLEKPISKPQSSKMEHQNTAQKSKLESRVVSNRKLTFIPYNSEEDVMRVNTEYYTQQVHLYEELEEKTIPDIDVQRAIEVPSFRVTLITESENCSDTDEDLDDESYLRRHQRHELEERRRKRWDLQRQREQLIIENLKKSQSVNRLNPQPAPVVQPTLTNIYPKAETAKLLEICETLPVNVFGSPLPTLQHTEFKLPWYKRKSTNNKKQKTAKRRRRQL